MSNPKLYILTEQFRDKSFELTEEKYTVGRAEDNMIHIPDPSVSGHHCEFSRLESGVYVITDLGSTNGSSVNEKRVISEPCQLSNGDIIMLGSVELMFENRDAENSTKEITRGTAVIDLQNSKSNTEVITAKMRNLGKLVNTRSNLDLRTRNRQNRMMFIIIAILGVIAVGIAVNAFLKF